MAATDTSPDAREVSASRMAEMTPAERVRLGVMLWQTGFALQRSALRRVNPDATEADIAFEIACRRFGRDLAQRAYGRE